MEKHGASPEEAEDAGQEEGSGGGGGGGSGASPGDKDDEETGQAPGTWMHDE